MTDQTIEINEQPSEGFLSSEWAETKPAFYSASDEAIEEIRAAAQAYVTIAKKHGLPAVAMTQVGQEESGTFHIHTEADIISMETVGPLHLLVTQLPFTDDPARIAAEVVFYHGRRISK
jgi:hypothetical protein